MPPYWRSMGSETTCAAVINRPVQLTKKPVPIQRRTLSPCTCATMGTILCPRKKVVGPNEDGRKMTISSAIGKKSLDVSFGFIAKLLRALMPQAPSFLCSKITLRSSMPDLVLCMHLALCGGKEISFALFRHPAPTLRCPFSASTHEEAKDTSDLYLVLPSAPSASHCFQPITGLPNQTA